MKNDIRDTEAKNLIKKLISFLGRNEIEKKLKSYQQSLCSSGPIFRDYYLRKRHPWWESFSEYFKLQYSGKSIHKHLSDGLMLLAGDAKKVTTLQHTMPNTVHDKYKRDLVDKKSAKAYLFEIQIAWHFYLRGAEILWYEDDGKSRPEFLVKEGDVEFNVECKRVGVDASRKIRRKDFYRLAELLMPKISDIGFCGHIDIILNDRLHGNEEGLKLLAEDILSRLTPECAVSCQMPFGEISLSLNHATGIEVDFQHEYENLLLRKPPNSHGAIFANSKNNKPVDPIAFTLSSKKADEILKGIQEKIKNAASQLDQSRPGLIVCYLEEVWDLRELASESGLQYMTCSLVDREDFLHVFAISYSAEPCAQKYENYKKIYNQALFFKNPNCKFEYMKSYKFFS